MNNSDKKLCQKSTLEVWNKCGACCLPICAVRHVGVDIKELLIYLLVTYCYLFFVKPPVVPHAEQSQTINASVCGLKWVWQFLIVKYFVAR